MATVQALARILADSLTTQERDGKTITVTKDSRPDWVVDVIHDVHGGLLPDDWTYEVVGEVAELIAEGEDETALEPEVYTGALLSWLQDYPSAVDLCDEAAEVYGPFDSITSQIQAGQQQAMYDIYGKVLAALEELREEEDREEDDDPNHVTITGPRFLDPHDPRMPYVDDDEDEE